VKNNSVKHTTVAGSEVGIQFVSNCSALDLSIDSNDISSDDTSSIVTGTCDILGNTINTLKDTGSGWTVNAYTGYLVTITSGTGVSQSRIILSNTADTLTVSPSWLTIPTGSGYAIESTNESFAGIDVSLTSSGTLRRVSVSDNQVQTRNRAVFLNVPGATLADFKVVGNEVAMTSPTTTGTEAIYLIGDNADGLNVDRNSVTWTSELNQDNTTAILVTLDSTSGSNDNVSICGNSVYGSFGSGASGFVGIGFSPNSEVNNCSISDNSIRMSSTNPASDTMKHGIVMYLTDTTTAGTVLWYLNVCGNKISDANTSYDGTATVPHGALVLHGDTNAAREARIRNLTFSHNKVDGTATALTGTIITSSSSGNWALVGNSSLFFGTATTSFLQGCFTSRINNVVSPSMSYSLADSTCIGNISGDSPGSSVTGTCDAVGNTINTLVDTGSGWTVNAYAGYWVTITNGPGVTQSRLILSNTADTLTVSPSWLVIPTASIYTIQQRRGFQGLGLNVTPFPLLDFNVDT